MGYARYPGAMVAPGLSRESGAPRLPARRTSRAAAPVTGLPRPRPVTRDADPANASGSARRRARGSRTRMFNYYRKELDWGGRKLVLETGKIARQADGAVVASYGDTVVLCTAVGVKGAKPGQDFFPLTVNYQEKAFAAGKIPGGLLQAGGTPLREGGADQPAHRPPDPPAVPGRVPQRGAGRRHRAQP